MITDEAVEAAARVFYHLQPNGTPLIREREQARAALEAALPHLLDREKIIDAVTLAYKTEDHIDSIADMAADRIIASQGCGTGHSGEQREPAVGATAALAPPMDGTPFYALIRTPMRYRLYQKGSDQRRRGIKGRWQQLNAFGGWENCSDPHLAGWEHHPDFAPAEREGSRDEPKTDEYEGCGKCVYCTDLGAHELCRGYDLAHPKKEGEGC